MISSPRRRRQRACTGRRGHGTLELEHRSGRADGGDRRSKDFQIDNIKLKTKGGTLALYTVKRLKRGVSSRNVGERRVLDCAHLRHERRPARRSS
jgi:hypothetical protein